MKRNILLLGLLIVSTIVPAQTWTNYTMKNSGITGNNILAITSDIRGNIWVGTTQGLSRYKDGEWTDFADFNEKLKNQFVNCLVVEGNTLWIGTDDYGVIEFNMNSSNWYEHAEETHRLNMKYIRDIAVDHAGVKWIGVTLSGFVEYDGVNWNKYTASESDLLSDFILCVVIDNRDRKWIGTNDGLCVFDGRRWLSYTTKNSKLPHNIVLSIAIDKDNVKWLGTLEGLCRFDGENWKTYNIDNCPIPGNQVNDVAIDKDGLLWMATDGGIAVFDGKDRWETFRAGDNLPKCMYLNVAIDHRGNRWFGTDEKGLFCLTGYKMADPEAEAAQLAANETETGENQSAIAEQGKTGKAKPKAQEENEASIEEERVKITPYLEEGYITITMNSPSAEVTFINAKGEKVRTVPKYQNGGHINISKMKKGAYTVKVKTGNGTRTVKFTLK